MAQNSPQGGYLINQKVKAHFFRKEGAVVIPVALKCYSIVYFCPTSKILGLNNKP